MPENITAIYKDGYLRPLHPLDIPENETVRIVVSLPAKPVESDEIIRIMIRSGLMRPSQLLKTSIPPDPVSEEERGEIGKMMGRGQKESLSEIIISERDQ